jgi:Undecaprenyl-phosphate glucose phosphotransferase
LDKKAILALLRGSLLMGDAAAVFISFILAYYVRFFSGMEPIKYGIPDISIYFKALPVIMAVFILSFNYAGLYRVDFGRSRFDEAISAIAASSASIIILTAMTFFFRRVSYSRIVIMHMWILIAVIITAWRFIYRTVFQHMRKTELIIRRLLIIGATPTSGVLIERLGRLTGSGYKVVGVIDGRAKINSRFCGVHVLGGLKNFTEIAEKIRADEVFVGDTGGSRKTLASIIMKNDKLKFMIASDELGIITKAKDFGEIHGIPVFEVKELPLNSLFNRFIKRSFDIVFSIFFIIILSPVYIAVALLVKLTSNGPVFYGQERVSRNGRRFIMLKFRTMKVGAEKTTGPVWASENDPRRTFIGGFLRKTSIDELPQFFNVLKGDISIVGPRPERPHFVKKFTGEIPGYMERHVVKGGLSGWAQVNGLRGDTSLDERVKYDIYYIENWTLWLDLKIIIRTALEIFHQDTAY